MFFFLSIDRWQGRTRLNQPLCVAADAESSRTYNLPLRTEPYSSSSGSGKGAALLHRGDPPGAAAGACACRLRSIRKPQRTKTAILSL